MERDRISVGVVVTRAIRETLAEVRLDSLLRIIINIIAPFISAGIVWFFTGSILWGGIAGVGVLLVISLTVFTFKMLTVPIAIANEERQRCEELEARQRTEAEREAAMQDLTLQIKLGAALYLQKISSNDEMMQWTEKLMQWAIVSRGAVERAFSKSKADAFLALAGFSSIALPGGCFNDRHRNGRMMLREWTDRLRTMINSSE